MVTAAAIRAAPTAIRTICQPATPPVALTAWTVLAGAGAG
jgi:hypothetical protein